MRSDKRTETRSSISQRNTEKGRIPLAELMGGKGAQSPTEGDIAGLLGFFVCFLF